MNALANRVICYTSAALLCAASIWYVLFTEHVTVAEPDTASTARFYQWFASMVPQERLLDAVAIAGVVGLIAAVGAVRDRLGAATPGARYGAFAVGLGGLVWVVDNTFVIGGHHAVAQMATHGNPIDAANEIAFTVDTVDHAFSVLTFLLFACGFAALAARARALGPAERGWSTLGGVVAAASLLVALGYIFSSDDLSTWALAVTGAVLLPGWLARSARRPAAGVADDATARRPAAVPV